MEKPTENLKIGDCVWYDDFAYVGLAQKRIRQQRMEGVQLALAI